MKQRIVNFITTDIWRIRIRKLSRSKGFVFRPLLMAVLAYRNFDQNKCRLRASALTFYSLLSIVPVVAMAFGIAKGFGFEKILEKVMLEKLPGQQEAVTQVIAFAQTMLENTKGGVVAGVGVALLFWAVINVLGSIEQSFNDIWGVVQARSLARKFSDYLSIMLIAPLLFIMSSSATVFISSQITAIMSKISFLGSMMPLVITGLGLLPFIVIWILFTFMYMFMPNIRVHFKSALLAGIAAGTVYQVVQWAYVNFQIGVSKANAIYGSFAALPLLLVWLQTSWMIVLFGAEISFASQNLETYEFEPDCLKVSHRFKQLLSLYLLQILNRSFMKAESAWPSDRFAQELDIPVRLVRQILFDLTAAGLVVEVKEEGVLEPAYQPGRCLHSLTIKDIIGLLEQRGVDTIPVVETPQLGKLRAALQALERAVATSKDNVRLEEI